MAELNPIEQATIDFYNITAKDWVNNHSDRSFWQEELELFQRLLPSGDILEIGSGGGRDAKNLIEAGYRYTGIEPSSGLRREAQRINPSAVFLPLTAYQLDFPPNSFDGFWASAVLLHIPTSRVEEVLEGIHRVVKNHGKGFISIKQGAGIEIEQEKVLGEIYRRQFVYYQEKDFKRILERNGYGILTVQTKPISPKTTWLNFFVDIKK